MATGKPSAAPKKEEKSKSASQPAIPLEDYTDIFHQPIMLRANFYRDNIRRLMAFCILLVLVIGGLMAWIIYERTHKPMVHYFATSSDGKLSILTPLNHPNLTTSALLNWVVEAATTVYNFNFGNYEKALNDFKIYFTDAGYQHFIASLNAAKILDTIKSKQLIVSAIATGTPVILQEGPTSDGIYAWKVQLPMIITYQSTSDTRKLNAVITMLIARRSTLESPKGIGIAVIEVKEL